jgi:TonB family protein
VWRDRLGACVFVLGAVSVVAAQTADLPAIGPVGPIELVSRPITPDNPVPRRRGGTMPAYPADAAGGVPRVEVRMLVTLDELGRVAEVRLFGEPRPADLAPFERAALEAVGQWIYELPASPPITFVVGLTFVRGSETVVSRHESAFAGIAGLEGPPPPQVQAWRAATTRKAPRPVSPPRPAFSQELAPGQRARVVMQIVIDPNGRVSDVRVVEGHPRLDAIAIRALRATRFSPALADGTPIPYTMMYIMNFTRS